MERKKTLTPEEQQDFAYSLEGAKLYREAEDNFWATFTCGADVVYSPEQEQSPYFGQITQFIDNLYTSVSLQELRDITDDFRLTIGTIEGRNHRGDREIFDRSRHHLNLHPNAEINYFGQQVECTNSQISTSINGNEYILLESKWDNIRLNPVEEEILDEIADIDAELRVRRQ